MNEHPILFSGEMVLAILDGRKTQTRRVIKPQPNAPRAFYWGMTPEEIEATKGWDKAPFGCWTYAHNGLAFFKTCRYGEIGDRLWVRETWKCIEREEDGLDGIGFRADMSFVPIENSVEASEAWVAARSNDVDWRPSIFMRRWMSRITLEIVNIWVERVQEITPLDAVSEGCSSDRHAKIEFRNLWNSINAKRGLGWDANPLVWAIEFRRLP